MKNTKNLRKILFLAILILSIGNLSYSYEDYYQKVYIVKISKEDLFKVVNATKNQQKKLSKIFDEYQKKAEGVENDLVQFDKKKDKIGKIDKKNLNFIRNDKIKIENCVINNFEVMHDAKKCLGYTFEYEGKKLSYASDVGCVNNIIKENLKNSDVIVLESNYDYNMLMEGPYHWELKNRVKGRNGHLSNAEASKLIAQVLNEKLKKIYLMHISKDNNTPELAYNSLYGILERENKSHLEIEIINENGTEIYKI